MPTRMPVLTIRNFKQAIQRGETPVGLLRKQYVAKIEKSPTSENADILQFTISTEIRDRDEDTIQSEGWLLDEYRQNPVMLWAHSYDLPPIASAISTWIEDGKLKSRDRFTPADLNPFGHMVYRLYAEGYLHAVSVGFQPKQWTEHADNTDSTWPGYDFRSQVLLEHSAVPVPSNPEALLDAQAKGLDLAPMIDWAEQILDDTSRPPDAWVSRRRIERLWRTLVPPRTSVAPMEQKGIITYQAAHPEGTPAAPRDEAWDAGAEVAAASVDDLTVMCAWVDAANPDVKGSYKFPHHHASGQHAVVFAALAAAAGRLEQAEIPTADQDGVRTHLGRHYQEDFEETPPWARAAAPIAPQKRGRVLSAANEHKLREANTLIIEVLAQLETTDQTDAATESGRRAAQTARPGSSGVGTPEEDVIELAEESMPTEAPFLLDEEGLVGFIREAVAPLEDTLSTLQTALTGRLD